MKGNPYGQQGLCDTLRRWYGVNVRLISIQFSLIPLPNYCKPTSKSSKSPKLPLPEKTKNKRV
jgi:hypothetical protein